jgi:tRNA/rRNA methyltransferase
VALVFGREDNGLSNEELALCTHIITIPSTGEYRSLNIAQAVMVCCYELFVATETFEPPSEKSAAASSEFRERMFEMWRDMMLKTGFSKPDKLEHMMFGLRRILNRGTRTTDDVRIMMGLARQAVWAAERDGGRKTEDRIIEGQNNQGVE